MKDNKGYIAITTALIVTIIILIVVLEVSTTGFLGRNNILNTHFKEKNIALTEGCLDLALLKLVENENYIGNETISIASSTCNILTIETNGAIKTIKAEAILENTETKMKVVLDTDDYTIVSWEELGSF